MVVSKNIPQLTEMMLSKPSSIKRSVKHTSGMKMLICVCMQIVIKICHVVQDLSEVLLTANGRTDGRTHIVIIVQTLVSCNFDGGDFVLLLALPSDVKQRL